MFGKKKDNKTSLEKAKNWYADRYQWMVVWNNVLVLITFFALIGLGVTSYTVAKVTESKTFEPYVIEVEEKTGITTTVDRSSVNTFRADDAVSRYFVNKYIQSREGYDVRQYEYNYGDVVRVLSSRGVYTQFRTFISTENPRSPLNLKNKYTRKVFVKSMTFLKKTEDEKKVQIRVLLRDESTVGEPQVENHAVITLDFDFLPLELNTEERYINPLGFQVLSYTLEEDVSWKQAE